MSYSVTHSELSVLDYIMSSAAEPKSHLITSTTAGVYAVIRLILFPNLSISQLLLTGNLDLFRPLTVCGQSPLKNPSVSS